LEEFLREFRPKGSQSVIGELMPSDDALTLMWAYAI